MNDSLMFERSLRYNSRRSYCGNNYLYHSDNGFHKVSCNSYSCIHCRRKLKKPMLDKIALLCSENGLKRHLMITCLGNDFRSRINANESFDYMSKKFNSFKILYKRSFNKKLKYIMFNRSQNDGYSHLHIMIGSYIPKSWLIDIVRRLNLGWFSIKYVDVHRLSRYLSKDWYKDREWFIPKGKRHFNSSQDIKLNYYFSNDEWFYIPIMKDDPFIEIKKFFNATFGKDPPNYFYVNTLFA